MKASEEDVSEDHYELDLEEHAPEDIDAAFKDAVAAVDRSESETSPEAGEVDDAEETSAAEPEPAQLASEATSLRERLMRTLADFDNFRKRTEREKQTLRRFANFDIFKDFLGVLDNFERAMEASGSADDLKQGLKMVVRQQEEILQRHGVQLVDAIDKPFDPKVHEAVAREESTEVAEPTVTKVLQKGYLLHDRLLRPAMVYVAMPASGRVDASDEATEDDTGETAG
ncbi:MAG: nucleotide exchange factor GrpE [Acidobacteriota bacterium]